MVRGVRTLAVQMAICLLPLLCLHRCDAVIELTLYSSGTVYSTFTDSGVLSLNYASLPVNAIPREHSGVDGLGDSRPLAIAFTAVFALAVALLV